MSKMFSASHVQVSPNHENRTSAKLTTRKELHGMRIASFNVENLFSRVRAMDLESWSEGKATLADYSALNAILQKPVYSDADKQAILAAIERLGLDQDDESRFVILRQNRGHLLRRPQTGPPEVVADGRGDWIGWLELKTEAVNEIATEMTARVIQDVNADILAVIEAEDRIALSRFNEQLLKPVNATYRAIMLIDGNDDRGIDVGLLTKRGSTIESMVSHVDDMENGFRVFSRDCPEYTVRVNDTTTILILVNHLKSKGYGSKAASDARRKAQAKRVREIYDLRRSQGIDQIAIVGDFNDTPDSGPLAPLLAEGSDLRDIFTHSQFQSDGRLGTFGNGTKSNKIDYILLSPALFARVTTGGIWRKGVWGGKNGQLFPHYDEMTKPVHAASDHAAIWADLDL
jgi:endonuclease/exonuclease/phosphatase family metal-dependent hydrolase